MGGEGNSKPQPSGVSQAQSYILTSSAGLTVAQIAVLQEQIKKFKALDARYKSNNHITKLIQPVAPHTEIKSAVSISNNNNNISYQPQDTGNQIDLAKSDKALKQNIIQKAKIDKNPKKQFKQNEGEEEKQIGGSTTQLQQPSNQAETTMSQSPVNRTGLLASGFPSSTTGSSSSPVAAVNPLAPSQTLNWQCFNSLLFPGPERHNSKSMPDGMIAISTSDMGCFSKTQHHPLVLTAPYSQNFREKYYRTLYQNKLNASLSTPGTLGNLSTEEKLFILQRQARSFLVNEFIGKLNQDHIDVVNSNQMLIDPSVSATIPLQNPFLHPASTFGGEFLKELLSRSKYSRQKKRGQRDAKIWDREDRRKMLEFDKKKKAKNAEFMKAVLSHRDEFNKFHRTKRLELSKIAKLAKTHIDSIEAKKEKDGAKIEAARLKALKENDMEAYSRLVQDTKNDRLKYLLNETDSYLATINSMIQQQRTDSESNGSSSSSNKMDVDSSGTSSSKVKDIAKTSGNYMQNTHRVTENVMQPRMLKGGDLKEYQLTGLQWLVSLFNNNLNGILADEMGLGKTIQAISLLTYLTEFKHINGPFLVVCPLSTLSNWTNEFARWAPDLVTVVYKGLPEVRKKIFKEEIETKRFNVLLTTYEYIMKDKSMLKRLYWIYIIVDEGHRMKNAQSKFTQILGAQYQSKHRILLTGTPLQNSLPELWSLLNFLLPTIFSSVDTFDQWFNKPFAAFKEQGNKENPDGGGEGELTGLNQEEQMLIIHRLHEVLRPFVLRRVKSQVLDQLPDKIERILRCEFSGFQRKLYRCIQAKSLDISALSRPDLNINQGNAARINNVWMQLKKVCNHPYLFLNHYNLDDDLIRISGKFELLDRMLPKLQAAGHRVLMFSQMTQLMSILEEFFNLKKMPFLRLDGGTTADEREKRMYEFNDPNSPYFIFILSTRAGGLGLNLATADTVIIFDTDWNPMMDAQAQDRAHRMGQKNEVRVFRLITNSVIEERILAKATGKMTLNGLVVEAGRFNNDKKEKEEETKQMMADLLKEWKASGYKEEESKKEKTDKPKEAASGAEGETGISAGGVNEGGEHDGEAEDEDDNVGNENDVPDEDQLNQMMAINEKEMAMYQAIDRRREQLGLHLNRLMTFEQRPAWITPDKFPSKYSSIMQSLYNLQHSYSSKNLHASQNDFGEDEFEYREPETFEDDSTGPVVAGKTMRKRTSGIIYDDGLSEQQFMRVVENEEDEQIEAMKREKAEKAANYLKSKLESHKAAVQPSKPTLISQELSNRIAQNIMDILKIKRNDGYLLCELFRDKPDKKFYPDYYKIIENPIALKDIQTKLKNKAYHRVEDILNDFALMSHNARVFNGESPVFANAEGIRSEFFHRLLAIPFIVIENREEFLFQSLPDISEGYLLYPESSSTIFSDNFASTVQHPLESRPVISNSLTMDAYPTIDNGGGFDTSFEGQPIKVPGKRGRKPNPEKVAARLAAENLKKGKYLDAENDYLDDNEQPTRPQISTASRPSIGSGQNSEGATKAPMLILSLSKSRSVSDISRSSSSNNISGSGPVLSLSKKSPSVSITSGNASGPTIRLGAGTSKLSDGYTMGNSIEESDAYSGNSQYNQGMSRSNSIQISRSNSQGSLTSSGMNSGNTINLNSAKSNFPGGQVAAGMRTSSIPSGGPASSISRQSSSEAPDGQQKMKFIFKA